MAFLKIWKHKGLVQYNTLLSLTSGEGIRKQDGLCHRRLKMDLQWKLSEGAGSRTPQTCSRNGYTRKKNIEQHLTKDTQKKQWLLNKSEDDKYYEMLNELEYGQSTGIIIRVSRPMLNKCQEAIRNGSEAGVSFITQTSLKRELSYNILASRLYAN